MNFKIYKIMETIKRTSNCELAQYWLTNIKTLILLNQSKVLNKMETHGIPLKNFNADCLL